MLSIFIEDPQFQGQTKDRLNNPELTATVDNFVRSGLEAWLNANMKAADGMSTLRNVCTVTYCCAY